MVIVARGASRNVRIVRMYPLTVLFTFTMVIIINCILGLTSINVESHVLPLSSLCYIHHNHVLPLSLLHNLEGN